MNKSHLLKIESLTHLHSVFGVSKPVHPLVSLVKLEDINIVPGTLPDFLVLNFYKVAYKMELNGTMKYGQNYYDFGEGGLVFTAPNQPFQSPDQSNNLASSPIQPTKRCMYQKAKDQPSFQFSQ